MAPDHGLLHDVMDGRVPSTRGTWGAVVGQQSQAYPMIMERCMVLHHCTAGDAMHQGVLEAAASGTSHQ